MPPAFHAMVVSLVTGLFFFTLIAVVFRTVLAWLETRMDAPLAIASDVASWWAGLVGTVLILGAMITGFLIWSPSAVLNSPVMRNKILASVLLLVTMLIFLVIRRVVGRGLWMNKLLATFYAFVALAAFHWSMVTNSIGGDLAGIPSGYETIVAWSGVDTRFTYYLPTWVLLVILLASAAMVALAILSRRSDPDAPARAEASPRHTDPVAPASRA